jgi:hypothetical protein
MSPHRSLPQAPARASLRLLAVMALLTLALVAPAQAAAAPTYLVGVIVSSSAGSPLAAHQARAAEFAASALARRGVYGAPFVVDVRDDGGDPRRAEAVARELIAQGALALVCCSAPAAVERVSDLAERAGVVLLGLDGAPADGRRWTLPLRPDARTQLTAIAVHVAQEGKSALALMTLDNAFGHAAAEAFERALADAGREPVGTVRYSPTATVLTPEALWAATRAPGAVVVWGLGRDTALALDGLRRRGWLGPAYVRPETIPVGIWSRLGAAHEAPSAPPAAGDVWWQVSAAAAPISVLEALPVDHPNREAASSTSGRLSVAGLRLEPAARASVAAVDDALVLLQRAFEEVAALGAAALDCRSPACATPCSTPSSALRPAPGRRHLRRPARRYALRPLGRARDRHRSLTAATRASTRGAGRSERGGASGDAGVSRERRPGRRTGSLSGVAVDLPDEPPPGPRPRRVHRAGGPAR